MAAAGRLLEIVGQAQNLHRPGPVGQPADEISLLKSSDQAVNARFGFEAQCLLHLVEGGRHPVFGEMLMDKEEQFVLFLGQHGLK